MICLLYHCTVHIIFLIFLEPNLRFSVIVLIKQSSIRFLACIDVPSKGVPSAVGFPHCAGSGEGLSLRPKPYLHKYAEAGARTRDLPVTDGRLYRCTRPALLGATKKRKTKCTGSDRIS